MAAASHIAAVASAASALPVSALGAAAVVLEPVPIGVACASDSQIPVPAACSTAEIAAPTLLNVLSTPVEGAWKERPATESLAQLAAIMDEMIAKVPDRQNSEQWRTYCTTCAQLAWHVKKHNQSIQQLFQHLVNDAIDVGFPWTILQ